MKVHAVLADPNTDAQIVILRHERTQTLLPIWIGAFEANVIRMAMEKVSLSRPMTHDLLKELLTYLKVQLDRVVINDVKNNTYYAILHLTQTVSDGNASSKVGQEVQCPETKTAVESEGAIQAIKLEVDARPSDAIALSLRCGAPLYVTETLLNRKDVDGLSEWLSRLQPKDFGASYNA